MAVVERKLGKCCICFPLQNGVAILTFIFFFLGLWSFLVLFLEDARLQFNGAFIVSTDFASSLQKLEPFVAAGYLLTALVGFIGVVDEKVWQVNVFLYYMGFHVFVIYVLVFALDMYGLAYYCKNANTSASDTSALLPVSERNMSLQALQSKNLCADARTAYTIGFLLQMLLRVYFFLVIRKYAKKISTSIPYPIAFEQTYTESVEVDIPSNVGDFARNRKEQLFEQNIIADMHRKDDDYIQKMLKEYGTQKSDKYGTNANQE
ncbi:unnamed protein product [Amoebophrya sp. A120]|nr:unnamed protein product [Amoebophrya sp. A120]|eukprot:GSA120T00004164001.1